MVTVGGTGIKRARHAGKVSIVYGERPEIRDVVEVNRHCYEMRCHILWCTTD